MKKQTQQRDYYGEIDAALSRIEKGKYARWPMERICDRIAWCWKFRRITEQQKDELCDRAIAAMPIAALYE